MRIAPGVVSGLAIAIFSTSVWAQTAGRFPVRPVRIIVPVAASGNVDLVARGIAQQMTESIGQQINVENRPGASALVGTQYVAKSKPDGYTILAVGNTFTVVPAIMANSGYDPLADFTGVSVTCLVPQVLVVNPALPAQSVKDLVALAKSRPGELTYGTSGSGATGHIAAEFFSRQMGISLTHVPYKGTAQAAVDLIGGQLSLMFDQISTATPQIKAGKLRALAVTSRTRSPLFPDLPTVDESGAPGYEDVTWNGLVAPAGTPREALVRLHEEVAKAVRIPALRKRFLDSGVELHASASPEAFTAYVRGKVEKDRKLATEAKIKLD